MPSAATLSLRRGEAGRAGNDVRSDLRVIFDERRSGGIEVELRSALTCITARRSAFRPQTFYTHWAFRTLA